MSTLADEIVSGVLAGLAGTKRRRRRKSTATKRRTTKRSTRRRRGLNGLSGEPGTDKVRAAERNQRKAKRSVAKKRKSQKKGVAKTRKSVTVKAHSRKAPCGGANTPKRRKQCKTMAAIAKKKQLWAKKSGVRSASAGKAKERWPKKGTAKKRRSKK